jgi:hypothetical protein
MEVRRPALFFWASAVLAATAFAVLAPHLLPYGRLGLETQAERERAWLLTVFCAGVLAVLFGVSAALGVGPKMLAFRDVADAGSVIAAKEQARRAGALRPTRGYSGNFALWTVAVGGFLLAIYFGLWLTLR